MAALFFVLFCRVFIVRARAHTNEMIDIYIYYCIYIRNKSKEKKTRQDNEQEKKRRQETRKEGSKAKQSKKGMEKHTRRKKAKRNKKRAKG